MKHKITDEQVEYILDLLENTWMPFKEIAKKAGVGYDMIGIINYGRGNWIKEYGDLKFPIRMTRKERNHRIYNRILKGETVDEVRKDYDLGVSATRKIYYKIRKQQENK